MRIGRLLNAFVMSVLLLGVLSTPAIGAPVVTDGQAETPISQGAVLTHPYVSEPVSPADTRGLPPAAPLEPFQGQPQAVHPVGPLPGADRTIGAPESYDPIVQTVPGTVNMPAPIMNFEGISATGVFPPDTNGQVGPDHFVQIVNAGGAGAQVRIWDKTTGTQLYNFGLGYLWPTGDACRTYAYGDPVVLYDQLADRWLLIQFALPDPPYYECIAVSKTGTPTNDPNDWYLYSFLVHNTKMNDYPKLGIWPDGYYMSANQFTTTWAGAGVWVFERDKMLDGGAASFQYFDVANINIDYGGLLPSNLMGNTLPPAGAPNYFMAVDMNWSGSDDILHVFEFHTDWNTPANSSFGLVADLVVAPFDWYFSGPSGAEVPQPDTSQGLDNLADRLMMHLWYRNFGDHESLVVNHTVDAGTDHHGIRWYEIRGGTVDTTLADATIYQQGTYAPDAEHRWMGSVAMDGAGNIALGYSVSSETVYPSIRYAGRLVSDPPGTLPQAEEEIIAGSGSQTGSDSWGRGRWGDYSAISVDPVDDCTFWYTQEYMETTSWAGWQTRIASFVFPSCLASPNFDIDKAASEERVGAGTVLTYSITITNTGGLASGVTISDTVPQYTDFAWADRGGTVVGDDVVWTGLAVPDHGTLSVSFGVTVTCVASGTQIANKAYSVYATEWPTPTFGMPVTVTAVRQGVTAGFSYPVPVLRNQPVPFTNLSQNATAYQWAFGDGGNSHQANPTYAYAGPTGDYTVVLTASNICTYSVASQPLTVHDYAVTASPLAAAKAADPGQTISYTLSVTNIGTLSDTFQVTAWGNDWPTQPSTDTLTLEPNEGEQIVVQVTVPAGAEGGREDSAGLIARSLSDPRSPAASVSAVLTTQANTVYGVKLGPAMALTGSPGETVTYTLIVTNTSNTVDTVTLARTTPGWPTTISPPSLAIAPGGWRKVQVYVTVPGTATGGQVDLAVIRATGSGDYAESGLTTTAAWYRIYLPVLFRNGRW